MDEQSHRRTVRHITISYVTTANHIPTIYLEGWQDLNTEEIMQVASCLRQHGIQHSLNLSSEVNKYFNNKEGEHKNVR